MRCGLAAGMPAQTEVAQQRVARAPPVVGVLVEEMAAVVVREAPPDGWYYAVQIGRQPGVYEGWDGPNGAKVQVESYSCALHCKFRSHRRAWLWVQSKSGTYPPKSIRHTHSA